MYIGFKKQNLKQKLYSEEDEAHVNREEKVDWEKLRRRTKWIAGASRLLGATEAKKNS